MNLEYTQLHVEISIVTLSSHFHCQRLNTSIGQQIKQIIIDTNPYYGKAFTEIHNRAEHFSRETTTIIL